MRFGLTTALPRDGAAAREFAQSVEAAELSATTGADPETFDSPFVLLGTHEQMAEQLVARQREYGIGYWTVFDELPGRDSALPDVAQVIALLR